MRDPFPYESNAFLIREILVPDPLSAGDWQRVLQEWQSLRDPLSLLEHLALHRLGEDALLEILGNSLGVKVFKRAALLKEDHLDATGQMLRNQGFEILEVKDEKKLLTGGSTFNPDLRRYLGPGHKEWEWVLISPIRTRADAIAKDKSVLPFSPDGVSNWLRTLVGGLWSTGARDMHFEIEGNMLIVRAHMSEGMQLIGKWPDGRASTVTRLLCTWSGISNWNGKTFADGRLTVPDQSSFPDLRFSAIPTVTGESLVLRAPNPILNKANLDAIGMPPGLQEEILDIALYHPGMIICTGPTGSGKTTTLYGILNELAWANLKILTIEDPVEQIIPFAVQSAIDDLNEWTFEKAIKAFLRQDPDVIMVGEIRDSHSAAAACRAALTGHCVLTTMHARDEKAAVDRLLTWGIPKGILSESLRLIINQRLNRCPGTNALSAHFHHAAYVQQLHEPIT